MTVHPSDLGELVVDGVRVFHLPGPSKTRATLCFGVGHRDESFDTIGVTHLVEHLAMAQLPKSHLDADASVSLDVTSFSAKGSPEEVGDALRRICSALADLPLEHLDREKDVVLTELSGQGEPAAQAAWAARYGFEGAGLGTDGWHGPLVITGEEVRAHAAAHFTAGRAALAVLGPLPEGLALPLPPTPPTAGTDGPPRRFPQPRLGDGPEWVHAPAEGVTLLLDGLARDAGAVRVAASVLCVRLERAQRDRRDVTFALDSDLGDGPDGDVLTVTLDVADFADDAAALLAWQELNDLATAGPTPDELAFALEGYEAAFDLTDVDVAQEEPFRLAGWAAIGAATGRPHGLPLAELAARIARTTCDDVRDLLSAASRRALVVLPLHTRLPEEAQQVARITRRTWCDELPALPPGHRLRPPALRRLFSPFLRRTLVVTDTGMACQDQTGEVHEVRWDDVVGVVELRGTPDGVIVVSRTKCSISLAPGYYGRAVYDEVLDRLAPHVERLRQCQRAHERADRELEASR